MNKNKPNIIQIIWHDLGKFLSCYGDKSVKTPNLDALAEEGTLLENMFCTTPLCSPSRGSIMTGCYPHSNGLMGLTGFGWNYHKGQRTITHILKDQGYKTYLYGVTHETSTFVSNDYVKERLKYDEVRDSCIPVKQQIGDVIAPKICDYIENKLDQSKPFFLSIGLDDVHRPFIGEASEEQIRDVVLPHYIPDTYEARKDLAIFENYVANADRNFGLMMKSIKKAGLENNTILLFITEHGADFNRAKGTLYDPGLEAACIFKWKNRIKENHRLKGMRSNIDVLPTLLDLADVTIPEFIQGESFKGSLLGYEDKSRDYIVAEKTYHDFYEPLRCIRTDRYKYIYNEKFNTPMHISIPHARAVGMEMTEKLYGKGRTEDEFYDLVKDPHEYNNLAYKEEFQEIKSELKRKLFQVLNETNDPLLEGDISPPVPFISPYRWELKGGLQFRIKVRDPKTGEYVLP